ncbi:MAG: hypothetical protein QOG85_143 [Gaiellaceae bacterium]|nr:hypothetical protein [Gaiellaceae bacterium]
MSKPRSSMSNARASRGMIADDASKKFVCCMAGSVSLRADGLSVRVPLSRRFRVLEVVPFDDVSRFVGLLEVEA